MPFEVTKDDSGIFPVILLRDISSGCSAEIYAFGAALNSFHVTVKNETLNIVDGYASLEDAKENATRSFKSSKLSPFVCRMRKGKYEFENRQHTIHKFYLGEEAIHGLLFDRTFNVKEIKADDDRASVTLEYYYNVREEGFPFSFLMHVTYTLQKNFSLTVQTTVTNTGSSAMPLGDGWHPYFQLGCKVNDLLVHFNSNTMLEFDEKLMPTGNCVHNAAFENPSVFGNTFLDNTFVLKSFDAPACTLTNTEKGIRFSVTADASYPYLQIFSPDHRNSIAIENLSSPPDSFNNKMALIILQRGDTKIFTTQFDISLI